MNLFYQYLLVIQFFQPLHAGEVPLHALHLATIQVNHPEHSKIAHMSIKVFSDDLQSAIRNADDRFTPGPLETLFENNEKLVAKYFYSHLQLEIDGHASVFTLAKWEPQNDVFLLTFQIACPEIWQNIHFQADFFMELFPDQSNVLSLVHGEEKQFARLTKQSTSYRASF